MKKSKGDVRKIKRRHFNLPYASPLKVKKGAYPLSVPAFPLEDDAFALPALLFFSGVSDARTPLTIVLLRQSQLFTALPQNSHLCGQSMSVCPSDKPHTIHFLDRVSPITNRVMFEYQWWSWWENRTPTNETLCFLQVICSLDRTAPLRTAPWRVWENRTNWPPRSVIKKSPIRQFPGSKLKNYGDQRSPNFCIKFLTLRLKMVTIWFPYTINQFLYTMSYKSRFSGLGWGSLAAIFFVLATVSC